MTNDAPADENKVRCLSATSRTMVQDLPFASASDVAERGVGFDSAGGNGFRDDGGNESAVVQAHRYGQGAEEASRKGNHAEATEMHLAAARDFFRAAEQVQEHAVLASSLLLLADSHAARAEKGAIRLRLSSDGGGSVVNPSSASSPSPTTRSARDLTPAEAYRAAASGVNASRTRGKDGGRGDRHSAHAAVGPDMDDSIMRGTGANSSPTAAGGGAGDAVAELAKKFRPQKDDLLELERQLAKLGLESKTGGARARARHRLAEGNLPHLSSALGDSFFFLNKSVIFGGAGAAASGLGGGVGGAVHSYDNGGTPSGPPPAARVTPGHDDGGGGGGGSGGGVNGRPASSSRFGGSSSAAAAGLDSGSPAGGSGSSRSSIANTNTDAARGAGRTGGEATLGTVGSDRSRRAGGGARQAAAGDAESGRGGRVGELAGDGDGGSSPRSALSTAADARRAKEEETQQGEIMRLLTCLKTLGDENVSLMKECEDRDKVRQESESIREEMRRFQLKYQERFTLLKKTLDEVMRSYPQLSAPGSGTASVGGGASGADSARLAEEVQRLSQSNRKLTEQVRKYEKYYKELCQKAESKRKEQLSQAKAARQQQLAHHPSFGQQPQQQAQAQPQQQQQQQQPQQQQPQSQPQPQQQQQQRTQRRLSPAPGSSRRTLQQQQQQGLPPQTRRSSSAPSSQQHPAAVPAAGAAVSGNTNQQHYPAFSQQHFRQNQQQPQNISSSQGVPGYRGSTPSQPPAAAVAVRGMTAREGKPTAAVGAPHQAIRGVAVNRSAGLVEESEV